MSWNYRVVKHDCEEDYYEIMEVYYGQLPHPIEGGACD